MEIHTLAIPTPFHVGKVNVYLLAHKSELTLIDTGPLTDEAYSTLDAGLANLGFSIYQIKNVLVTHGHQDHYGLANRIARLSSAEVYVPQGDVHLTSQSLPGEFYLRELARAGLPGERINEMVERFITIRVFSERLERYKVLNDHDTLSLDGGRIEVLHTPGHTPGSSCYFWRDRSILFAGDTILKSITPNPVLDLDPQNGRRFKSLIRYMETLDRLREINPQLIYGGHRDVVTNYSEHHDRVKGFYRVRQDKMLELLEEGAQTAYQLCQKMFPTDDDLNTFLAISETLANLDMLVEKREIDRSVHEDVEFFFKPKGHEDQING
jgi:glyoxylase-like metal-dependent hydrolase (beta-lactamase superfamily II)